MSVGALGGAAAVFLAVAYVARSIEPGETSDSDAILVMIEIVLVPIGLALGAAGGALVASWFIGPEPESESEAPP